MNASIEGTTISLQAEGVEIPLACRYAVCGKPAANLLNKHSHPVYPFRTDDWDQ